MVKLEHITKAFNGKLVLQNLSLELPERGICCLMGPSGCGKTTLLRILLGLEKPDQGQVTGLARSEASVLFQEDRLLPWLTVRDNLTQTANCSAEIALHLLEAVELAAEADALPEQLSGGMRRRVALTRALAYPAKLMVFDEPFKGLDEALKQRLYPLVRASAARTPLLFVTHDLAEAEALADRILIAEGPPLQIIKAC